MNWHKIDPNDEKTWPPENTPILAWGVIAAIVWHEKYQGVTYLTNADFHRDIRDANITHWCEIEPPGTEEKKCAWKQRDITLYETECDHSFEMMVPPKQWGMDFCCFCGKPLIEEPYKEPEDK